MGESGDFFKVGGALPPGSHSYVLRRADGEIVDALLAGEFVFVLDSRQKGKSSLIVRSLEFLQQNGVTPVRIDLQSLGANLTPEQWYGGLLHALGQDLGLTGQLWEFWKSRTDVGPMNRWFLAIESVILPNIATRMVIFIDEIDFVRSLPFSTDEFFAGIRECFNRRSTSPEFNRLTFCFAGVAAPSQLIKYEEFTPFNIGRRVELTDFTRTELEPYSMQLSNGGRDGGRLLNRIFYWVGGHPYLTQLLASFAAREQEIRSVRDLDRLVYRTLLSRDARQREPNTADVERRLLEAAVVGSSKDESRSQVLDLYRLLLRGGTPLVNRDESLISLILLSGIAVEESSKLRVRNRLYRTLFDERWRRTNLPDAEARRQRAASARAAWRVAWISVGIFSLLSLFLLRLLTLTHDRDLALGDSKRLNRINIRSAYEASIALAWDRIDDGNYIKAFDLVQSQSGAPDKRWEWRFLTTLFSEAEVLRPDAPLGAVAQRPLKIWREQGTIVEATRSQIFQDGKSVLINVDGLNFYPFCYWLERTKETGSLTHRIEIAQAAFARGTVGYPSLTDDARLLAWAKAKQTGFDLTYLPSGLTKHVEAKFMAFSISISHDGRKVLILDVDRISHLYDVESGIWKWSINLVSAGTARISPDDRLAILPTMTADVDVVRMQDGSLASRMIGHSSPATDYAWFRDSKRIITCSSDGSSRIWNTEDGHQIRRLLSPGYSLTSVSLDSGENSATLVGQLGSQLVWNFDARPTIQTLTLHRNQVLSCTLSPDGKRAVTTSKDGTSRLIDVPKARPIAEYWLGVPHEAHPVCFSPKGDLLVEVATSGETDLIEPSGGKVVRRLLLRGTYPVRVTIARNGRILLALREGGILTLDNAQAEPVLHAIRGLVCSSLSVSNDQTRVAVGGKSGEIILLDAVTLKNERLLHTAKGDITHVEFSPDGRWLAASSTDSFAYLFALDGSNRSHVLTGHWARTWGARFSPDSSHLLTNSYDGTARVWDVESGAPLLTLQHASWVSSAEWSPDGRRIVTGCADGYIRLFDSLDGFELLKLSESHDLVLDANFTPDGRTLMSVGADRSVRFWRSEPLHFAPSKYLARKSR